MNKIVKDQKHALAKQKMESRMVQKNINLTQALDEWQKVVQTEEDKKDARRKAQIEKKANALLASIQEANMIRTLKEKWSLPLESSMEEPSADENNDDDIESITTGQSTSNGGPKNQP